MSLLSYITSIQTLAMYLHSVENDIYSKIYYQNDYKVQKSGRKNILI